MVSAKLCPNTIPNSSTLRNATRVTGYLKTQVNPAVFKPINPGLTTGNNPGLRVQFWVSISKHMQYKNTNNYDRLF